MITLLESPIRAIAIDPVNREIKTVVLNDTLDVRKFLGEREQIGHNFVNKDSILVASDTDWYNPPPKFWYGSNTYGFKEFKGFGLIVHSVVGNSNWGSCLQDIAKIRNLVKFEKPIVRNSA